MLRRELSLIKVAVLPLLQTEAETACSSGAGIFCDMLGPKMKLRAEINI
jgi:hypothetical protein